MATLHELSFDECLLLLRESQVGRVAVCSPDGPHIIPVNFSVVGQFLAVQTSPYSVLGTYGDGTSVAFEVDAVDSERLTGWSVMVRGRAGLAANTEDVRRLVRDSDRTPWADGTRNLVILIPLTHVSGRSLGPLASRGTEAQ